MTHDPQIKTVDDFIRLRHPCHCQVVCGTCEGSGRWTDQLTLEEQTCPTCNGLGYLYRPEVVARIDAVLDLYNTEGPDPKAPLSVEILDAICQVGEPG